MIIASAKILEWLRKWGSWLLTALFGTLALIFYFLIPKKTPAPSVDPIKDLRNSIEEKAKDDEWEAQKQAEANAAKIINKADESRVEVVSQIEHDTNSISSGDEVTKYLNDVGAEQR